MTASRFGAAALVGLLMVVPALSLAKGRGWERRARPARTSILDQTQLIDVNRISMIVTNFGSFAFDAGGGHAGLEFPKGSHKTAVFAGGLWLGGKINGVTKVAVTSYSNEWFPGPIQAGGVPANPDAPIHKVYKLDRVYADDATRDAALADYNAGALPYGADTVTVETDGSLNILGDQMTWCVYNEADSVKKATSEEDAGRTGPMGIEVQQTIFSFNRLGALGNTVFLRFRMINKGANGPANTIDSMYVSVWSDPDLGQFDDDLVGSDVPLSMGFCYNATNNDGLYGTVPPAVGYDFFRGPTGYSGAELGLTSFNKYTNEPGGDPEHWSHVYNFMRGLNRDGSTVINPVTGNVTTYVVSGDPVSASGWLDSSPADRRLMLSSGPFQMTPGDTQEVVVGIVIGDSPAACPSPRLSSISLLRFYDSFAQSAFDQNFDLAPAPNAPVVTATPTENSVILTWDSSSEAYDSPPYEWEGYVVYQGSSLSGPWKRLTTFDRPNGITTLTDPDFDCESGQILPRVKALGTDAGVAYRYEATQDFIRGGALHVGTPYYFAVTSYAVGVGQTPQVLESAINFDPDPTRTTVFTVIPQTPAAGRDLSVAGVGPVTPGQVAAGVPTTDTVFVRVIDRSQMVGATYRVGYKPDANGVLMWYVVRTMGAAVDTVVNNQTNFSGDNNYPVFDGIQVVVLGAPLGRLHHVSYVDVGPNPPGLEPADLPGVFGLCFGYYFCAADYGINYLGGSALDPDVDNSPFVNAEVRFTGGAPGSKAYRYVRASGVYLLQDMVDVPWSVWDVDNNIQLAGGFLETAPGVDSVWQPDSTGIGNREAIFIFSHPYTATPDPYFTDPSRDDLLNEGPNLDIMYFVWPISTVLPLTIDAGDKYAFVLSGRSTNDFFTFSTTGANPFDAAVARSEMERIKAVPNPYFAHSRYELNQFNRAVKFTHLPARCTIRIYNLAGDLIRTLEKDDANTSQLTWDLETASALPVASGIYIFHVDAPGVGSQTGKVAIFMEKERLNTF